MSQEPAGGPGTELADAVAQRSAEISSAARAARDAAAARGALVWDPFDPAWVEDPYAVYARLRRDNPVHRSPLGFWVFTRHADCLAMLRDRRSSSDARNADYETFRQLRATDVSAQGAEALLDEMAPFLFRDPPDHTRLRGLVQKAFTPRVVEGLRPRIAEVCDALLDEILARGQCDLVADYAYPLPVQIIVEMLGVPADDHEQFRVWSHALARGLDPDYLLPPDAATERLGAIMSFVQYFAGLIAERRQHLGDDVLSRLIEAEEEGDVLTQGELLATCILLLVAGHETTVNLISGGAEVLMGHPEQLARMRDDDTVVRAAVEEMLRYVCPVQLTGRIALEDMEVGGALLRKGEFSMLLIGSANRDPEAFVHPETFDITRADNNHLGFGFGIHHCLGAPLARLEAQIALPALLRRARHLERTTDVLSYKENIVLRGLDALPVALSP